MYWDHCMVGHVIVGKYNVEILKPIKLIFIELLFVKYFGITEHFINPKIPFIEEKISFNLYSNEKIDIFFIIKAANGVLCYSSKHLALHRNA